MDFSKTLFRCSSLGHLMSEPKSKADKEAGNLSEGAKTHLMDKYVSVMYNRKTDINTKYTNKGLMVEEDSITLFSRLSRKYYKKNSEHLSNDYIMGTPDLYTGKSIKQADMVIDVKSSWDVFTFFRTLSKDVKSIYYWQLQGYMGLTGAKVAKLAYCLIDTPLILINDEKRKLLYKMGAVSEENEDYTKACEEIEANMSYQDIPMNEKVITFTIERSDTDLVRLYNRVDKGREYLRDIYETLHPSAVVAEQDLSVNATQIQLA